MFSSITKSLASIVPSGPRALLASYIAAALSEHFVVDKDAVESSLLNEPRLVLLNTHLRRRRYRSSDAPDAIVTVEGEVQEVNFSWRWSFGSSGNAAGGVVQDASLTISGLKARIIIQSWSEADEATRLECLDIHASNSSTSFEGADSSGTEGYLQNCIQQVVDHLTLKLADFEFVLDLKDGPSVIIGGEDLHLETLSAAKGLAKDGSAALNQKLSIGSFHVNVEEVGNADCENKTQNKTPATRHPVIEPFGYSASVTRLSGKRFQGGILSGLEIVGLPNYGNEKDHPSGVVFHAGREQMQALFALGKILAPPRDGGAEIGVVEDWSECKEKDTAKDSIAPESNVAPSGSLSTVFILPLPKLTLVLPGTHISLPRTTATYRTDGRLFSVQGNEGIQADGNSLIGLEEGGKWVADLVKRSFVIAGKESGQVGEAIATVALRKDSVTKILSAIETAASSEDVSVLAEAWEHPSHQNNQSPASEQAVQMRPEPWSFSAQGTIILRLEDGDEWVDASLMRPALAISDAQMGGYTPRKIECGGIKINTCYQGASVLVPPITLSKDGGTLNALGALRASIESVDVASKLGDFLSSFTSLLQTEPSEGEEAPSLPFKVEVQAAELKVNDCNACIRTGQTKVCGNELSFASINYSDLSGTTAMATETTLVLGANSSVDVMLAQVEKCAVAGFNLISPLKEARASFRDGKLFLKAQSICLALPSQSGARKEGVGESSSELSLPFPVNIKLDLLKLERLSERNSEGTIAVAYLRGLDLGVSPSERHAEVVSRSRIAIRVERSQTEWLEGHIGMVSLRAPLTDPSSLQNFLCTGAAIGPSSFGQFSVQVPSVSLQSEETEEIGGVLTCKDTIAANLESTAVLSKVQDFLSQIMGGLVTEKSETEQSVTSSFLLPPVRLPGLKLTLPNVQVLAEDIDMAQYAIRCGSLRCQGADGASALLKEVLAVTEEAKVIIESVESLSIPGIACLSDPIKGTTITYTNGSMKVASDSLNVVLSEREVVDSGDAQENSGAELELPFPIRVCLNTVCVKQAEEANVMVQFRHIDVGVSASGPTLKFDAHGEISIHVSQSNAGWIECKIDSPSVAVASNGLADTYVPKAVQCASVAIGPCSFGKMSACTSSFALSTGTDCMSFDGPLAIEVESLAVIESIQSFVLQVTNVNANGQGSHADARSKPLPFSMKLPELKFLLQEPGARMMMQGVTVAGWEAHCSSVHLTEASGASASMLGVKGNFGSDTSVRIESLFTLEIPGILTLSEPVHGARVVHKGGALSISLDSLQVIASSKEPNKATTGPTSSISIPIPIHLALREMCLKKPPEQCAIYLTDIKLEAESTDAATCLMIHKDAKLRIEESSTEWIEASFGAFSCICADDNTPQLHFAGGAVGPCSYGHFDMQVPSIGTQDGLLTFSKNVEAAVESPEVVQSITALLSRSMGILPKSESSNTFSFPVQLPGLRLSVSKPQVCLTMDNIAAIGVGISCESIHVTEGTGLSASLSGIKATVLGQLQPRVGIGLVEALFIPGVANLIKPVKNVSLSYENEGGLVAKVPSPTHMHLLPEDTDAIKDSEPRVSGDLMLPFPVCLDMFQLNLKDVDESSSNCLRLCQIVVDAKASNAAPGSTPASIPTPGAVLSIKVGDIDNELFQVHNMKASALVNLSRTDVIQNLQVGLESGRISAGFSSVDWSALLGGNECQPPKVIKTPFASVAAIKLEISYKGMIAASETSIDVSPFVGDSFTTSEDLVQHYSKAVISRAPGFIANAEIMGSNVIDSTFTNAGRMAMTQSLVGSGVGSVVGVAAVDGVKGAIASGKKARSADVDEGYKFGDVTRGTIRAVRESVKSGAMTRRGNSDHYVPGDLTAGASAALSEYASSNKSRLSAAGGGGVGSVVGLALAGPIGFVAGSYIGSKAGSSAVGEDAPKDVQGNGIRTDGMQQTANYSGSTDASGTQIQSGRSQPQMNRITGNRQVQTSNSSSSRESGSGLGAPPGQDLLGLGPGAPTQSLPAHQRGHGRGMPPAEDLLGLGMPPASQSESIQSHGHHDASLGIGVSTCGRAPESQHVTRPQQHGSGSNASADADLLGLGQSAPAGQQDYAARSQHLHTQVQGQVPPQQNYAQGYAARSQRLHTQAQVQSQVPPQQNYAQGYAARSQQLHTQAQVQSHVSPQQQRPVQHNQGGTGGRTHQASYGNQNFQGSLGAGGAPQEDSSYHFGDITRGLVAKGKKKAGRDENSSYKFGDFSRGLFGK